MEKNFDAWTHEKKRLEFVGHETLVFHEREIWWCSIGINLGDEEDGKNQLFERPVLVLKKFNKRLAWVLPMSTKEKLGRYYYRIEHNDRAYVVLLSQLRLVSTKRFHRFVRKISPKQFYEVQQKIIFFLE